MCVGGGGGDGSGLLQQRLEDTKTATGWTVRCCEVQQLSSLFQSDTASSAEGSSINSPLVSHFIAQAQPCNIRQQQQQEQK